MLNTSCFVAYLVLVLLLGLASRLRSGPDRTKEFFLASRGLGAIPIGLSVMATAFSGMNYAAMPAEAFGHGLYVAACLPVFVLVAWPVTRWIIPFYHRLQPVSVYAWLEQRYDRRVRVLASVLFVVWRLLWMGAAPVATARVLAVLTGWPEWVVMLVAAGAATAYTCMGGLRAVVWTDMAQFVVLLASIIAILMVAAWRVPGGMAEVFELARGGGRLSPWVPWDPEFVGMSLTYRMSLWSVLAGVSVTFLARFTVDQSVVQRYFAAKSVRDAQRGVWISVAGSVVAIGLLLVVGLALYALAVTDGSVDAKMRAFARLPKLLKTLPYGLAGLAAAGLAAATMSSVDSGIHACATSVHCDLLSDRDGGVKFAVAPWVLTVILGVAALGAAFAVGTMGDLFSALNRVVNGLGSPLLAMFAAGLLFRRVVNARGVFYGGIAGVVLSVCTVLFVSPLALHHYATINFVGSVVLIVVMSVVTGGVRRGRDEAEGESRPH